MDTKKIQIVIAGLFLAFILLSVADKASRISKAAYDTSQDVEEIKSHLNM